MRTRRIAIAAVGVALVVLLNLPLPASLRVKAGLRDNVKPFQSVFSFLTYEVREGFSFLVRAGRAADEREALLQELAQLRETARSLQEADRENEELRRLLGFARQSRKGLVPCRVIARDMSGWWQTARLNKGSADGIEPNRPVVAMEGLVGQTREVSRHTCDVLLISDPNCKVAAKFSRTGAFGVVTGTGLSAGGRATLDLRFYASLCRMDYVSKEDEIRANDEIVTSGLGGLYPEGLLVGYVRGTALDSSGLYQRADVVPAADLAALRYVFVVTEGTPAPKEAPAAGGRPRPGERR